MTLSLDPRKLLPRNVAQKALDRFVEEAAQRLAEGRLSAREAKIAETEHLVRWCYHLLRDRWHEIPDCPEKTEIGFMIRERYGTMTPERKKASTD